MLRGPMAPHFPMGGKWWGLLILTGTVTPTTCCSTQRAAATVIWYMNNNVHIAGAAGPTLPGGWNVAAP